jgi:multimeric flavodoxin WrbA
MSSVILLAPSPVTESLGLLEHVRAELSSLGEHDPRVFDLSTFPLAYCQGEFDCWVKTPGVCRAHDQEDEIARAVHDASRLVLVDEVTFGGHSSRLKRAQDRLLCLTSPFFEKRVSLTHHEARYAALPSLYAIGGASVSAPEEAETFAALADANSVNLKSPRVGAYVIDPSLDDPRGAIARCLSSTRVPGEAIGSRDELRRRMRESLAPVHRPFPVEAPRKIAILIGSAKPKGTSVSEQIVAALEARFARAGTPTVRHFVTELLHEGPRTEKALADMVDADTFVVVAPLYWDALPSLVTSVLERVARASSGEPGRKRLCGIVNCGFPEPEHTRTAFRILRHFAERAGYSFVGGLALGGGGMMASGTLEEPHGPVVHVAEALDLTVHALACGQSLPETAIERMAFAPIPDAAYRLMGDLGWRWQAHTHGLEQRELVARPLDTEG